MVRGLRQLERVEYRDLRRGEGVQKAVESVALDFAWLAEYNDVANVNTREAIAKSVDVWIEKENSITFLMSEWISKNVSY